MNVSTPDILRRIIARKSDEIRERSLGISLNELRQLAESAEPSRPFRQALERAIASGKAAVIAEMKRASPSKGLLRNHFEPEKIAKSYQESGASCLSVLTDRDFFCGSEQHLKEARAACNLPVLRKDFTIAPYHVYEARAAGADCILLIVAALDDARLKDLGLLAGELGMDVLVEVHDLSELSRALRLDFGILGINNRNLHSFETRLETTLNLLPEIPDDRLVVTESGIQEPKDVRKMEERGVHAFLVGEAFMRAPDPGLKLRELFCQEN